MEPHLNEGSLALFRRCKAVARGDIVLVEHPQFGTIVKKVSAVGRRGNIHLRGTSRHSTSARELGSVPRSAVAGVMLFKLF